MVGVILGISVGVTIAIFAGLIFGLGCELFLNRPLVWAIIVIALLILGGVMGGYADNCEYDKYIYTYPTVKNTIESSLNNENLSGLERIELVKQATELNSKLVKTQYSSQQWYGFTIDDKVMELEPINLNVGGTE